MLSGTHILAILVILAIALIIFGPKRLPELGEGLGRAIREFRKATSEMSDSLREEARRTDPAAGMTHPTPASPPTPPAETPVGAGTPAATPPAPPTQPTPPGS